MRRAVWVGVTALLLVVAVGVMILWRDARAAEAALRDARTALNDGEQALTADEDSEAALAAFRRAGDHADRARTRLDGPSWAVVGLLPRIGGSAELARAATELADASADLGVAAANQAEGLLDASGLDGVMADGRVDLDRLGHLAATVGDLPTQAVLDARERLAAVAPGTVLASLRDDRAAALAQVDAVLSRIDRVMLGLDAVRTFLGADGPRTYLVAAQNPAELRGTGGLIGFMTELTVDDGAISLADGVSVDAEDELARRSELDTLADLPDPVQRPAAFADRYDHIAGGSFFGSVNADPDLPTVAPVLLDLYAQEVGSSLDGAIMVDPIALGMIVSATGRPLELPAELDTAGLPHQIPGDRLADVVMVDGYDAFHGGGAGKKALDQAIILAGFERLTVGGWDAVEMGRSLGEAFATRHLQLFSRDEDVQSGFQTLGLAGQMAAGRGPGDVLAVTGINAAADKSDVHVAHRIRGQLQLGRLRDGAPATAERDGTLQVTVDNPLRPGDHDIYITGSNEPLQIGGQRSERVDDALNRTWFSVWTLPTTEATELREGDERQLFRATSIHGHRVFDYFLETPSASTNSFEIDLDGRVELSRENGGDLVYRLTLWRQAKAIPDHWDLTLTAPQGWQIVSAVVEGGGAPTGMGAGGDDGQPLRASVEDGSARLVGAATTDAVLNVTLTDARRPALGALARSNGHAAEPVTLRDTSMAAATQRHQASALR